MDTFEGPPMRNCSECNISEEQAVLFTIILPPEVIKKTPYCRACMDMLLDRSRKLRETAGERRQRAK